MTVNRRTFLSIAALSVSTASAHATHGEKFPIIHSEIELVDYRYRRREVKFNTAEPAGTIVVDTKNRYLYFVLGEGRAMRYGVGVGKEGFAWSGEAVVGRKAKWPRWTPTKEAIARTPIYKQYEKGMEPGGRNPMGARGIYLFNDGKDLLYRIHGTSEPSTIGKRVSTGCLRMINVDVADLYERVDVGTRVVVMEHIEQ
jgi:lipoprotein-anchoring transpeptidase ErfK/SrfK